MRLKASAPESPVSLPDSNNLYISIRDLIIEKLRDSLLDGPLIVKYRETKFGNRVLRVTHAEIINLECRVETGFSGDRLRLNGVIDLTDPDTRNLLVTIINRIEGAGFSGSFELYDGDTLLDSGSW